MTSTKYKIKDLVTIVDERNTIGIRNFFGINKNKEFMPTNAKTEGLNEKNYKLVYKNRFVYSGMQTGRDKCIRISMYTGESPIIVSPAYTTFEITATDIVIPDYFFMTFLSNEKDRMGWFYSDSSIRANLDWEIFCDIEIDLPPLHIQEKYVAVYKSILDNQKAYETGLDDLKIVCDGYFDRLKKDRSLYKKLGYFIEKNELRNVDKKYGKEHVRGISNKKEFMLTKADVSKTDLSKFLIIPKNFFAYNSRTDGRDMLVLAINKLDEPVMVTWNYNSFKIKDNMLQKLNPDFLYAFLKRAEFDRLVRFMSWGSSQELFSWDSLCDVQIPVPNIQIQNSIAQLYNVYLERKQINEKLKQQIKDICPILIAGAIKEANANG